jgi:hypothetical protein
MIVSKLFAVAGGKGVTNYDCYKTIKISVLALCWICPDQKERLSPEKAVQ